MCVNFTIPVFPNRQKDSIKGKTIKAVNIYKKTTKRFFRHKPYREKNWKDLTVIL